MLNSAAKFGKSYSNNDSTHASMDNIEHTISSETNDDSKYYSLEKTVPKYNLADNNDLPANLIARSDKPIVDRSTLWEALKQKKVRDDDQSKKLEGEKYTPSYSNSRDNSSRSMSNLLTALSLQSVDFSELNQDDNRSRGNLIGDLNYSI